MKPSLRTLVFLLPWILVTVFTGPANLHAELKVASLSTITTDLARQIGGDRVKITEIIRPGMDPHDFQPTTRDIRNVAEADLVLFTGKGIEGFLAKLRDSSGGTARFLDVSVGIPSLRITEEGGVVEDPHWWHSVSNMRRAAQNVAEAFAKADPENSSYYGARLGILLDSYDGLERWIRVKVAELPRPQRKLVTSHDALQYFVRDYGFVILPVKGVSTGEEPSSKHVKELIGIIRKEGVKSVFLESIENSRAVNQIALETGARMGGVLYSDGLGEKEASTYDSMMRHNVSTIVDGLK
jgi:zinc/manganese transport system substrate-binding protein